MTSTVRSLLSTSTKIYEASRTHAALKGAERLFMSEHRALLQAEYQGLLQQSGADGVVSTTFNTSAHWLREKGFFSDMKRNNDITYYVVGRGHKGVDPVTGEEFAFQVQPMGGNSLYGKNHYCVPRAHGVSAGEEKRFSGYLGRINMQVLKAAREAIPDAPAGLLGASINFDGPAVYIEY